MLKRNIYLIYPAGFSGTYVNWSLSKSEISTASTTVDSPLNLSPNKLYGGQGTAHLHHRLPTHCSIDQVMYWIIKHKPIEKKIYSINCWDNFWLVKAVNHILSFDENPLIIQISASDKDYYTLGHINAITKWPLYFQILELDKQLHITFGNLEENWMHNRNAIVRHYDSIFSFPKHLDFDDNTSMPNIRWIRGMYKRWYDMRNEYNPHEVNTEQFIEPKEAFDYIHFLDLENIYNSNFVNSLEEIIDESVGDYNFSYVKKFHETYLINQNNLKFLNEIRTFRNTKTVSDYLTSSPLIEAIVIKEILPLIPNDFHWESKTLKEIINVVSNA